MQYFKIRCIIINVQIIQDLRKDKKMQEDKKDIFDRIMSAEIFSALEPFYKKHKEMLLYLFFGGCTTLVGIIFFQTPLSRLTLGKKMLFGVTLDMDVITANVISWICAVTFAYVTNRIWVFADKAYGAAGIAKECAEFFAGRLFTLVVETVLLNILVESFSMNELLSKILVSIVTIILNYVISKLFVFKPKK